MRVKSALSVAVSVLLVGASLVLLLNFQSIFDWYRLRNYTPPTEIAGLADASSMTDEGRKLFYVNRPELNDKTTFRQNCTSAEASLVLGCYVSNQGIYIYDVNDKRLAGVEEVTAAHEMLHVAYERLSDEERQRIDTLTAEVFVASKNIRLQETIAQYRADDPSVVPNELHSILGTEVRKLPAELETHYKQYSQDRAAIVTLAERYESAFTERENKIASYDKRLATLETKISSNRVQIDSLNQSLTQQRQTLDSYINAGNYEAYNSRVDAYNSSVNTYNNIVNTTQADIETYNELVEARNEIALEERQLYESLDSRSFPEE